VEVRDGGGMREWGWKGEEEGREEGGGGWVVGGGGGGGGGGVGRNIVADVTKVHSGTIMQTFLFA